MPPPTPAPRREETSEAIKETLESLFIAFILAFVFRSFVVEAFIIPTGSMAPTLLGRHLRHTCPQCGYRFTLSPHESHLARGRTVPGLEVVCPMCHYPDQLPAGVPASAGDRILVHKFIYEFVEPRRWDVVVFKNPQKPAENYIKRLVGLPGEELFIIEGNVYTRPQRELIGGGVEPTGPWRIARKTDTNANPHAFEVQRAVWRPVYSSRWVPLDGGKRERHAWSVPWTPGSGDWEIEGRRSYRLKGEAPGELAFDFAAARPSTATPWSAYNQLERDPFREPIEDLRVAVTVVPEREPPANRRGLTLQSSARLDDDPDAAPVPIAARLAPDGRVDLSRMQGGAWRELASGRAAPLRAGEPRRVELWFVDQHALVWVDGAVVAEHRFELSLPTLLKRAMPSDTTYPRVRVALDLGPATVGEAAVDRDIYYTPSPQSMSRPGLGTLAKSVGERDTGFGEPIRIGADQFYCLGENSSMSSDSRAWSSIDDAVSRRYSPSPEHPLPPGIVPRGLMMGRAFFVYFPTPLGLHRTAPNVLPNFGDMRRIH